VPHRVVENPSSNRFTRISALSSIPCASERSGPWARQRRKLTCARSVFSLSLFSPRLRAKSRVKWRLLSSLSQQRRAQLLMGMWVVRNNSYFSAAWVLDSRDGRWFTWRECLSLGGEICQCLSRPEICFDATRLACAGLSAKPSGLNPVSNSGSPWNGKKVS
jgi:hypothetical protein